MSFNPYVIGISGGSGIGKTVLSNSLAEFLGLSQCLVLSTDDLHRWKRHDPHWKNITHLNPVANNIEQGVDHLKKLKNGNTIKRKIYNHETGNHNDPVQINPERFIIQEGLHAFYGNGMSELCDLKIFIETTDSLKRHWKIVRDTKKRGYTKKQVISSIEKRARDHEKYLACQKRDADVVVFLSEKNEISSLGNPDEIVEINLKIFCNLNVLGNSFVLSIISFLENDLREKSAFIGTANKVGKDKSLVTDSGGNLSVKTKNDKLLIKSSGCKMSDMTIKSGYTSLVLSEIKSKVISVADMKAENSVKNDILYTAYSNQNSRASMETGMHVAYSQPCVLHTHPVYVLTLLCLDNSKEIINTVFGQNFEFDYIDFVKPGSELTERILEESKNSIAFLENHGLIVASNSLEDCFVITKQINKTAMDFIKSSVDSFEEFCNFEIKNQAIKGSLFPDDIILNDPCRHSDTIRLRQYVESYCGLISSPRYLCRDSCFEISSMKFETDRKDK